MSRKHVVITGTGRSGTTFLLQLLTRLGLDTGYSPEDIACDTPGRAGLEQDVRKKNAPFIVKSPWFCDYAHEVLQRDDIVIEHVFIPMRDLHAAADSRRHVAREAMRDASAAQRLRNKLTQHSIPGGLWHTRNPQQQEIVLLEQIYKLMVALSDSMVPVTLLQYPRITLDSRFLYAKLLPILQGIDQRTFEATFKETVRPELVHAFADDR